jgi:hypothetical protein
MDKEVSIVLSKERSNFRKVAQEWYGLSDDQMVGVDVHHNPPRYKGGRNIPEHLYIYSESLHASVHENDFVKWSRRGSEKAHTSKTEDGKSVLGVENAERLNSIKNENGKSVNALKGTVRQKELGIGIWRLTPEQISKNIKKIHEDKNEEGKSKHAVKAGKQTHREKNEEGKSINAVKTAKRTNAQVWESTIDGFRGNPGVVAMHNKRRGWDPNCRVKVS